MPGLRELQLAFGANLLDAGEHGVLSAVRRDSFEPAQRTQIYRNNTCTGFTDALRAIYPVVERLVGEGFFLYTCHEFIARHPSVDGNLHAYGREFAEHLDAFEPARGLAYLPDVARLEWLYHEVYHAADADGLRIEALSTLGADQYPGLRFQLHPARRLMQSPFPILDIWRVNQPDHMGDQVVDLDAGGVVCLLLSRSGEEVVIQALGPAEFEVLRRLNRQCTLSDCVDAALALDPAFDLQAFLLKHIQNGTLTGFTTR